MKYWGTWLAQLVECATLDLRVMSSSPIFEHGAYSEKKKRNMKYLGINMTEDVQDLYTEDYKNC